MRRLGAAVCAFGLLLALPVSAATAKVVAVPLSLEVRSGNDGNNNCAAVAYLQWPAQKDAEAWRIEYLWSGKLTKAEPVPPFHDDPLPIYGWAPPQGAHWYRAGAPSSKSAANPETHVDCTDLAVAKTNAFGGGTIYITVPDTPEEDEAEKKAKEEKEEKEKKEREKKEAKKKKKKPPKKKGAPKCRGQLATISVKPGPPTNGTKRRDVIIGTPKRDVIRARGGNDLVCGLGGNDIILGGGGRDVLLGQGGGDTIRGQGGADTAFGGAGNDHLFGDGAADRLFGEKGGDALNGGGGKPDLCDGGPDEDQRKSPGCERRRDIP